MTTRIALSVLIATLLTGVSTYGAIARRPGAAGQSVRRSCERPVVGTGHRARHRAGAFASGNAQ